MIKDLSPREYDAILRSDLGYFAERCFCYLNPQAAFLPNWHIKVIAAKLAAVAQGKIQRLIINLPPRHLRLDGRLLRYQVARCVRMIGFL
jgi:hypothetical protein